MRRDSFLKLTELSVDQHKTLARHDSLPFFDVKEREEGGWGDYWLEDVFLTSLALQLAGEQHQGMLMRDASSHVVHVDSKVWAIWWDRIVDRTNDNPICLYVVEYQTTDGRRLFERSTEFVGPWDNPRPASERTDKSFAELQQATSRITVANVNGVVNAIRNRAKMHGIEIDLEKLFAQTPKEESVVSLPKPRMKPKPPEPPFIAYRSSTPKRPPKK
jgi:hypothetical protein